MGADGIGPDYCRKACDDHRDSGLTCNECPRPTVLPANVAAVNVFNRCGTQWKRHPNGKISGLDYPGVETVMRRRGVADENHVFDKIQIMEEEAINIADTKTQQQA